MRAAGGTPFDGVKWPSAEALERAHGHAAIQALWGGFAARCDFVPVAGLAECQPMFPAFDAISS